MPISFEGQVAIVTGAGGGLGRAYALELGRRGASVVVNDLQGADDVVSEIVAAGGKAVACGESVATPEGGKAIVDQAVRSFGSVDAIIHNAGAWRHGPYEEMTPDRLDAVLDVHLRGAVFVTQPAWAMMKAKGYGRIVLTSSSAGAFGRTSGANYCAAKAAMLGLCRALSLEGGAAGIYTNSLLPVAPFEKLKTAPKDLLDHLLSTGLPQEDSTPEAVAPMAVYLASAACRVNGEAFSAGGRRFGRVFVGVADGWVSPPGYATAEDIEAHLAEIEDLSSFSTPGSAWEELGVIGRLRAQRDQR